MAINYPFSPQWLDALPHELSDLYRGLEDRLIDYICKCLKATDDLNESALQRIRVLRSHRIDLYEIEKIIKKTTGISDKKIQEIFTDVVARNQQYYRLSFPRFRYCSDSSTNSRRICEYNGFYGLFSKRWSYFSAACKSVSVGVRQRGNESAKRNNQL